MLLDRCIEESGTFFTWSGRPIMMSSVGRVEAEDIGRHPLIYLVKDQERRDLFSEEKGVTNKDLRANHCKLQVSLTGSKQLANAGGREFYPENQLRRSWSLTTFSRLL